MGNRMALGITTILTIMFLLGSLNGNLPKVSYPKALDWYLLVSFTFVFLSLMECMVVFLFASKAKQDETQIKYKVTNLNFKTVARRFLGVPTNDMSTKDENVVGDRGGGGRGHPKTHASHKSARSLASTVSYLCVIAYCTICTLWGGPGYIPCVVS